MKTHNHMLTPFNFAGLGKKRAQWSTAGVAVIPVPYDLTTSYRSGTRSGPLAIIEASTHMELFDDEINAEIADVGICTLNLVEPVTSSPDKMISRVAGVVSSVIREDKFPVVLGGEHSITLGAVTALSSRFPDFGVVQLDAHADLRDQYQGSKYNHACIGRRISERFPLTQIGIRSLCSEEHLFLENSGISTYYSGDIYGNSSWIEPCVANLPETIYITIDLDVLDPSIMPSVGTPEPGGLLWYDVLYLLRTLAEKKTIIGFDIVELCPMPSNPAPDFLAAKLCYKLIGYCKQSSIASRQTPI